MDIQLITHNPRVAFVVGQSIEALRAEAANSDVIRAFLELFVGTRIELGVQ